MSGGEPHQAKRRGYGNYAHDVLDKYVCGCERRLDDTAAMLIVVRLKFWT